MNVELKFQKWLEAEWCAGRTPNIEEARGAFMAGAEGHKSWPSEPTEAMLQDGARAYEHHLDHARPGPHTQAEAMSAAWMAIMSHLSQPHKPDSPSRGVSDTTGHIRSERTETDSRAGAANIAHPEDSWCDDCRSQVCHCTPHPPNSTEEA